MRSTVRSRDSTPSGKPPTLGPLFCSIKHLALSASLVFPGKGCPKEHFYVLPVCQVLLTVDFQGVLLKSGPPCPLR